MHLVNFGLSMRIKSRLIPKSIYTGAHASVLWTLEVKYVLNAVDSPPLHCLFFFFVWPTTLVGTSHANQLTKQWPFPPPLVENLYTVSSRNAFQVFGVSLGFWKIPKVVKRRHLHIHHTNSSSITAASLLYLQERPSTMFRLVQNFCEKTLL